MSLATAPAAIKKHTSENAGDELRRASTHAHHRRLILKWLAVAACMVCLNLLFWEGLTRYLILVGKPASSPNPQLDAKFRVAETLQKSDDNVVLCGDSLMKQGLYPELLEANLKSINKNLRVVNLAHTGGTQRNAIFYLEYLKSKGIKPRLLVYDFGVGNTGFPANFDCDSGQYKSYLFTGMLSRPAGLVDRAAILPSDCSHLIRQRGTLKRYLDTFCAALFEPTKMQELCSFPVSNAADHGFTRNGMLPVHRCTAVTDLAYEKKLTSSVEKMSPRAADFKYNADCYATIANYCEQNHIPLMLVWLPLRASILQKFYYQAPFTEDWFKQQFLAYRPGSNNVFAEYMTLPDDPTYFVDFVHLNTYGCMKTSEAFIDILKKPKYRKLLERQSS